MRKITGAVFGAARSGIGSECLAECVAEREPNVVRFLRSDRYVADHLGDLREWTSYTDVSREERSAYYTGAWRLFRNIAEIVPRDELLAEDLEGSTDVYALLKEAGKPGAAVLKALEGGVQTQREAFDDSDGDGLINLRERLLGLDPTRWDTDGDGWWDSAPEQRPQFAIPLSGDGTPACLPWVSGTGATQLVSGGNARGFDLGAAAFLAADDTLLYPYDPTGMRGGYYVAPKVESPKPNPFCGWSVAATVIVEGGKSIGDLTPLTVALDRARRDYEAQLGPSQRVVVIISPDRDHLTLSSRGLSSFKNVEIPLGEVRKSLGNVERVDHLAAQVLAMHWLAQMGHRSDGDAGLGNALREHIRGKGPVIGDTYRGEIKKWQRKVQKCGSWEAFLAGTCT